MARRDGDGMTFLRVFVYMLFGTLLCMLSIVSRAAPIDVLDDAGNTVRLPMPAQRIVTLSPHAAELVFAAGAGARIVGAVSYSDYPDAAKTIPRVGSNSMIDIERLIALKPDLLVVWLHGGAQRQLEKLRSLGVPLFYSEPRCLQDIPDAIERLGKLAGTAPQAQTAATALRTQLTALDTQYRGRPPVRLFYQVYPHPLYTLNDRHIVGDAIRLCGGVNIFGSLQTLAPTVSVEAVLLENPEVVITGDLNRADADNLALWRAYPAMLAVQRDNLFALDGDLLNRPGPRMIEGAAALCKSLEIARGHRPAAGAH
jgi:iron complex transport system substrate-binding protein